MKFFIIEKLNELKQFSIDDNIYPVSLGILGVKGKVP